MHSNGNQRWSNLVQAFYQVQIDACICDMAQECMKGLIRTCIHTKQNLYVAVISSACSPAQEQMCGATESHIKRIVVARYMQSASNSLAFLASIACCLVRKLTELHSFPGVALMAAMRRLMISRWHTEVGQCFAITSACILQVGSMLAMDKQFEAAEVYLAMAMESTTVLEATFMNSHHTADQRETAFEELCGICLDRLQVAWELKQQVGLVYEVKRSSCLFEQLHAVKRLEWTLYDHAASAAGRSARFVPAMCLSN